MTRITRLVHHHWNNSRGIPGVFFILSTAVLLSGLPLTAVRAQNSINIVETHFTDGWDPFTFRGLESYRLLSLYAAPMCELNARQIPERRLADTVIEGDRVWTVRLTPNVNFADGRLCPQADPGFEPVKARDVEATYRAFMDTRTEVGDPQFRELLKTGVQDLQAVDDQTVKIEYKPRTSRVLRYAAMEFPILPAKLLSAGYVTRKSSPNSPENRVIRSPYGAGYFFIQGNSKPQRLDLSRNDRLPPAEAAKIAKVTVNYYPNPESIVEDIVGTNWSTPICMPDVPVDKITKLSTAPEHRLQSLTMNRYNWVAFNCARPLLADARVRKALSCAINRKKMLGTYANEGDLITGPFPADSPNGCDTCRPSCQLFDTGLASRLLDEAGWRRQPSGRRVNSQGQPLTLRLATFAEAGQIPAIIADRIKGFWEDLGVTTTVDYMTLQEYDQRVYVDKNFDAAFGLWSFFLTPNPSSTFRTNGTQNFISYSNPELDAQLDSVTKLDTDERTVLYHRIHMKIAEDAPYAFLYSIHRYALLNTTIEVGPNLDPFNFFRRVNEWYLR